MEAINEPLREAKRVRKLQKDIKGTSDDVLLLCWSDLETSRRDELQEKIYGIGSKLYKEMLYIECRLRRLI